MIFNAAIEGRVGANWTLAVAPYGFEPIIDYTTFQVLAGRRADYPPVPQRGLPSNMSAGLSAMQAAMGTRYRSYATLAEMEAYVGWVGRYLEREEFTGETVREEAPLFADLVSRMRRLAEWYGVPHDRVRLVWGFD